MASHSPPLDALVVPSEDYHQVPSEERDGGSRRNSYLRIFDSTIMNILPFLSFIGFYFLLKFSKFRLSSNFCVVILCCIAE